MEQEMITAKQNKYIVKKLSPKDHTKMKKILEKNPGKIKIIPQSQRATLRKLRILFDELNKYTSNRKKAKILFRNIKIRNIPHIYFDPHKFNITLINTEADND